MKYIKTYENQELEDNLHSYDIVQTIESHSYRNVLGTKMINAVRLNEDLNKAFYNNYCEFYVQDGDRVQIQVDGVQVMVEALAGGGISRVGIYFVNNDNFYKVDCNRLVKVYKHGFVDTKEPEAKIRWYKKGKLEND